MDKNTKKALTITVLILLLLIVITVAGIGFGILIECNAKAAATVYLVFWALVLLGCVFIAFRKTED